MASPQRVVVAVARRFGTQRQRAPFAVVATDWYTCRMLFDTAVEVAPGVREAGACTAAAAPRAERAVATTAGIEIAVARTGEEFDAAARLPVAGNIACPVAGSDVGEVDDQRLQTMVERSAEEPADTAVAPE